MHAKSTWCEVDMHPIFKIFVFSEKYAKFDVLNKAQILGIIIIIIRQFIRRRNMSIKRRLTEQIQCQRRFTIVEVVTDWHWL